LCEKFISIYFLQHVFFALVFRSLICHTFSTSTFFICADNEICTVHPTFIYKNCLRDIYIVTIRAVEAFTEYISLFKSISPSSKPERQKPCTLIAFVM